MKNILNIGVLAHVDAGKTTLTEQILFRSGIIDQAGSVDQGNTITDSLEIERRRGITIKSAAVSFMLGDLKINLIDTPGHADFISEVEHSLSVLDGVILVISAVEGVQAQTRVLMQTLKEQRIPTLLFMNKIDRMGANYHNVFTMIRNLLDEHICEMSSVTHEGSATVRVDVADPHNAGWVEMLALSNDDLLNDYVQDIPISRERLQENYAGKPGKVKLTLYLQDQQPKGSASSRCFMRLANISLLITPRSFSMNRYPAWCSK